MELIVLDPGHFHAALLQKEMYPELAKKVAVYAPLGPDVLDYLGRISRFNSRVEKPTAWELDVHLSPDPLGEMLRQRPGSIVVLSGRNQGKIDRVLAALNAGLHVLADKPWIVEANEMPKLERALDLARERGLAAYDIMTEVYEVTSQLQRELVNDPEIFGRQEPGTASAPGIEALSVHYLMKTVAGVPLRRPPWFFELANGEALADVGTHVVDLVQWTACPDQAIDFRKDIKMLEARRWPLTMTREQFSQVTGELDFSAGVAPHVRDGRLDYFCNNAVHYKLRGVHVKLEIVWKWEAEPGTGDVYAAVFRGSKAVVEIRQGPPENFIPEVYVSPLAGGIEAAVEHRLASLAGRWPNLKIVKTDGAIRIAIPPEFRVGHEAHFAQVAKRFFELIRSPETMPAQEAPNMLSKYEVCTRGVELARPGL